MRVFGQRIEPFRGLFYNPTCSGPIKDMIAPPYDLIGPAMQDSLYQRSPYNVVRIELARDPDRYQAAAYTLRGWLRDRILIRASKSAIYLYTQRFMVEGRKFTRHGFVLRIQLEDFAPGRILPHERTFPAAKEDRLRLLIATQTNISSIFGLYMKNPALDSLRARASEIQPLFSVVDDLGIENELREISNPEDIAALQQAMAERQILIADGHHRYETALEYGRRRRAADPNPTAVQPYDYTMMTLVAADDPGLVILATHRVVKQLAAEAIAAFVQRAGIDFTIAEFADRRQFQQRLIAAGAGAIGVAFKGDRVLRILRLKDLAAMAAMLPTTPAAVRELDVSILHTAIFERIFGITPEAVRAGGNLDYTIDFNGALDKVADGETDGAFLMNPPSIHDVERVSAAAATMPEKSTYFFPKLATGLVMNPLTD